ncbi:MAG: hypothetical protein FWG27_01255 [Treponema sp.]|nr:hypothetical protein [Treponema sp.]
MKHLCIINPMAGFVVGRVNEIEEEIRNYFAGNPRMNYTIHITRWKRDASGYTLRYVNNASEMVRVYAFGGGGTLFEVINGVMGLPNVQVAYYPLGKNNDLLTAFRNDQKDLFRSMRNLSLSPVLTIDTIQAGNHYVVSTILIGTEAASYQLGEKLSERFSLPLHFCYIMAGFYYSFLKAEIRHYRIEMQMLTLEEDLMGILVSNVPGHGTGKPAPEAQFNDGYMNVYTIKPAPRNKIIKGIMDYRKGQYAKWPEYVTHYRCKKLRITSSKDMIISLDGEIFYDAELNLKMQSASLDFVCPPGIDETIRKLEKKGPPNRFLSGELS